MPGKSDISKTDLGYLYKTCMSRYINDIKFP